MAPDVTTGSRLAIEFISALGMAPPAMIEATTALGVDAIGLAPAPITGPLPPDLPWSLRDDPALLRATHAALQATGVRLVLGEGFLILPGRDIADAEPDIDLFAGLGARRLNAVVIEPDLARATDQFAHFAAMAAARGLPVTVEFMPMPPIDTLAAALALVAASGAGNAGVMVDAMHLYGSGGSHADLAEVDPALIGHAQLCDSRALRAYPDYFDHARTDRPAPGEGVLPLAQFVAALPPGCPVGLELPMVPRAQAGLGFAARMAPAIAAARALLKE